MAETATVAKLNTTPSPDKVNPFAVLDKSELKAVCDSVIDIKTYSELRDSGSNHDDIMIGASMKPTSGKLLQKAYHVYITIRAMDDQGMLDEAPYTSGDVAEQYATLMADAGHKMTVDAAKKIVTAAMKMLVDAEMAKRLPLEDGKQALYYTDASMAVMQAKIDSYHKAKG